MPLKSVGKASGSDIMTVKVGPVLAAHMLRRLFEALETMYGVFLILLWIDRARQRNTRRDDYHFIAEELMKYITSQWVGDSESYWGETFHDEQAKLLSLLAHKLYDRAGAEFESPLGRALSVRSARVDSPGVISFEGLGEPIREVRELIKDFWFRNKQEKLKGELDLEHQAVMVARERLLLNAQYRSLAKGTSGALDRPTILLSGALQELFTLEIRQVIQPDPDALNKDLAGE